MSLQDRIRLLKEIEGIPNKFVAQHCEVRYPTFKAFMTGRRNLHEDEIERIEDFLREKGI